MRTVIVFYIVIALPHSVAAATIPNASRATQAKVFQVARSQPSATTAPEATRKAAQVAQRRCAFLGIAGSFHILGNKGTAAYNLRSGQFIAELVNDKDDPNWWVYRQIKSTTANNNITKWAFARQPNACGRYWVLRMSKGVWRPYEATNAWGVQLGGSSPAQPSGPGHSVVSGTETTVTVINATERDLPGLWVVYLDASGKKHNSKVFSVRKGEKFEIEGLPGAPRLSNEKNVEMAVRSKDGSFDLGKPVGIPLSQVVYHGCSDGKVAVGIVLH